MDRTLWLIECAHKGDKKARETAVQENMGLVRNVVKRYQGRGAENEDLIQIGCIGLLKAIDYFNLELEVRFSTYAVPMITGEIKRYLRDNSAFRVSRSVKDLAYKILKLREEMATSNGVEPSDKELAKILDVSEYDIANALDSLREPVSMYEPIYNDGGDTIYLYDQISNKKEEYDLDYKLALDRAIDKLKPRERNILESRFIVGKTQMEIAEELGISQAQISRIEKNVIKSLKKYVK